MMFLWRVYLISGSPELSSTSTTCSYPSGFLLYLRPKAILPCLMFIRHQTECPWKCEEKEVCPSGFKLLSPGIFLQYWIANSRKINTIYDSNFINLKTIQDESMLKNHKIFILGRLVEHQKLSKRGISNRILFSL